MSQYSLKLLVGLPSDHTPSECEWFLSSDKLCSNANATRACQSCSTASVDYEIRFDLCMTWLIKVIESVEIDKRKAEVYQYGLWISILNVVFRYRYS